MNTPDPALDTLTTREIADRLGIPVSKVKNWIAHLSIPHEKDSKGHRRFSPEMLAVFRAIDKATADGRGYPTIRRAILPAYLDEEASGLCPVEEQPAPATPGEVSPDVLALLREALDRLDEAQERNAQLREVAAAHQERARQYEERYSEAKQRVLMLEAPKDSQEQPRPWWKLWG